MAGAALDSFEAANPCDMVLWLLLPAGHNINLSLALLQKVADCKLECRAIQVFLSEAEFTCSDHFVRHHKGLWTTQDCRSLMAGRVADSQAFKTMVRAWRWRWSLMRDDAEDEAHLSPFAFACVSRLSHQRSVPRTVQGAQTKIPKATCWIVRIPMCFVYWYSHPQPGPHPEERKIACFQIS